MNGQPAFIRLTGGDGRRFYVDAGAVKLFLAAKPGHEGTDVSFFEAAATVRVCETPDDIVRLLGAVGIKSYCLDSSGVPEEVEP